MFENLKTSSKVKKIRNRGVKTQGILTSFKRIYSDEGNPNINDIVMNFSYTRQGRENVQGEIHDKVTTDMEAKLSLGMVLPIMYHEDIPDMIVFEQGLEHSLLRGSSEMINNRNNQGFNQQQASYGAMSDNQSQDLSSVNKQIEPLIKELMTVDKDIAAEIDSIVKKMQTTNNMMEIKQLEQEIKPLLAVIKRKKQEQAVKEGTLSQEMADIVNFGQEATAIVLDSTIMKRDGGERAEVRLKLRVMPSNGNEYQAEVTKHIPPECFSSVEPGNSLIVYYMPDNPHKLAVGFSTL